MAVSSVSLAFPYLNSSRAGGSVQTPRELFHPPLARGVRPTFEIGIRVRRKLNVERPQGGDVLVVAQLIGLVAQRAGDARRPLARPRLESGLERPVALQQVGGGLLADPLAARQTVGR